MITAKMMAAAAAETHEQMASQWSIERVSAMRTDAIESANNLHFSRFGVYVATLSAELEKRANG